VLALSQVETQGLMIACSPHFAQEVVIIGLMILISRTDE